MKPPPAFPKASVFKFCLLLDELDKGLGLTQWVGPLMESQFDDIISSSRA